MLIPNQAYYATFTTQNNTGAATSADSTPTATLRRNGSTDAAVTLTVTNLSTGQYKITGTIPGSYTAGDVCQVEVAATVAGLAGKATIDSFVIDTTRSSDVYSRIGTNGAGLTALGDARLARLDATVSSRAIPSDITNALSSSGFAEEGILEDGVASILAAVGTRATPADVQPNITVNGGFGSSDRTTLQAAATGQQLTNAKDTIVTAIVDAGLTSEQAEQLDFIYSKFDQTPEGPVALVPAPPAGPIPLATLAFDATAFGIAQPGVTISYEMVEARPVKIADRFQIPRAIQATTDEEGRALVYLYPSSQLAAGNYATSYRVNCPEAKLNALIEVPDEGALLADLV